MSPREHVCTVLWVAGRWVYLCQRHPDTWGQPVPITPVRQLKSVAS